MPESSIWLRCCLQRDEIPPGMLCLLILKTLALHGELHGYEIADSI
jgi:DNA-binding PadR family transcriptional regulator